MNSDPKKDIAASVQARLLNRAKARGDDYQVLLSAYVCERFLRRLGVSSAADRFVLKGAMLLRLWSDHPYRATQDLDLLRRGSGEEVLLRQDLELICRTVVEPDGLEFDAATMALEAIRAESEYVGTRALISVRCAKARIRLQVDIGIGDVVFPNPRKQTYPVLLDALAPEVFAYARETVIAEKFEAMLVHGDRNSRIKDFFDIHYLASSFDFDGQVLCESMRKTLSRRATDIPDGDPHGLTAAYWENPTRPAQIKAFARRAHLRVDSNPADSILTVLRSFMLPPIAGLRPGGRTPGHWKAGGPWSA